MPDFTFTSPEGKDYTVSGPEGATKEQAYSMLQQQLASKAQPAPKTQNPQSPQMSEEQGATPGTLLEGKTAAQRVKEVGVAGAFGGIAGAVAPEIVTGAGMAMEAIPGLQVPGAATIAAGRAMRAGRVAEAVYGALSGVTSEAAGQGVEMAGGSEGKATAARVAGGFIGPGALSGALNLMGGATKMAAKFAQTLAGGAESIPKAVAAAREALSPAKLGTQPALAVHEALAQGVAADRQAADATARQTIADAEARAERLATQNPETARRVVEEARAHADQLRAEATRRAHVLDVASDGKLAKAAEVHKAADAALTATVGPIREVSDIGQDIRKAVVAKQGAALAEREAAYKSQVAARDAIVAEKQGQGITIDSTKGIADLKAEIDRKLLITKKGQTAAKGLAEVKDPGTALAYRQVYDAINLKRVQTGVDEAGNPTFKTFKNSFEALDQVRRRLGDVAFGTEKEGYGALGQKIAKDLYEKISNAQKEFVGPEQEALQAGYREATGELNKFGAKPGVKATALDRMDQDKFAQDAAGLPSHYFKSQQSVKDLRELMDNPKAVFDLAKQHTASQLAGKSSVQVRDWAKSNSDWMREVPGLRGSVESYAAKVEQAERVGKKLESRAKDLQTTKTSTLSQAEKEAQKAHAEGLAEATRRTESRVEEQQKIVADARKSAEDTRKATLDKVESVIKKGYPAESTRNLLMHGTPEEHAQAMRYLEATPGGRKAMVDSVKLTLREASPRSIGTQWAERMKPMLEASGVNPATVRDIEGKVNDLVRAASPAERVKLRERVLRSLVAATVGDVAAKFTPQTRTGS